MSIPREFQVEVDGLGTFTFRRRTMQDQIRIEAEARRVTGSPLVDDLWLEACRGATLQTLLVQAPEGFDLIALDPLNADDWLKLSSIFEGLRAAEERFRGRAPGNAPAPGAGVGGQPDLRVPPPL